ncbi:hypothetical protein D7S86_27485 [Pararobbsia silviterrae]|uniref:Uncharacterized protein n=1 Tax=Pararobbsia silviterrae TaxID=1792498 RepID=A0A494X997_9BURK|nr:hypothetical protein D7S86_27485 [Pararobbsia silviterrae]
MPRQQQTCFYCALPATQLCDHVLGRGYRSEAIGIKTGKVERIPSRDFVHTCDMPLCTKHAERRGVIHIKMGRTGTWDTYDYCPEHPKGTEEGHRRVLKDGEALSIREAVQGIARRRAGLPAAIKPAIPNAAQGELF